MARKKIVKPTGYEQAQIDIALRKKYPHMFKETWVKKLKKKVRKELEKRRRTTAYGLGIAEVSKKKVKRMGIKL